VSVSVEKRFETGDDDEDDDDDEEDNEDDSACSCALSRVLYVLNTLM
jgi:hypothetical protein